MKFNDALLGAVFLALSIAVLITIQGYPKIPGQSIGPGAFPGLITILLAGCSLALIWRGWRERHSQPLVALGAWLASPRHLLNFGITVGVLVFYVLAAEKIGFLICGAIILLALFLALRVKPRLAVGLAFAVPVLIHFIFYKLLRVPLPWGVLPVLW
ncbi:MAG TPA: tripartite tricarboxylate transporter TctB family protein [Burkholderiales bacterium]|nr:tripartite tricarboxylate transporter TctB family protein [Burkholderiales bacterium]